MINRVKITWASSYLLTKHSPVHDLTPRGSVHVVCVDADLVGDVGGQLCAIGGVWVNIKHQACERIMGSCQFL